MALAGILYGNSQVLARKGNLSWAGNIVALFNRQSPSIGEAWTRVPLPCANWSFNPPYAFHGSLAAPRLAIHDRLRIVSSARNESSCMIGNMVILGLGRVQVGVV